MMDTEDRRARRGWTADRRQRRRSGASSPTAARSRSGDLFVALKGERFDGHEFVAAALAQGATAALVAADRAAAMPGDLIAVPDPLAALGHLAAFWRAKFDIPLAVVVGSNGKTTVKEMTAAIFRAHFGDAAVLARKATSTTRSGCR